MYYCCGITEKGVMPHNEDALLIGGQVIREGSLEMRIGAPFIAAVSDGVSGENAGELASAMCLEQLKNTEALHKSGIRDSIMAIHEELVNYSRSDSGSRNMQTTLCGIAVAEDESVIAFNVGDSRLYRYRDGVVRQLSRDQSLVQLLYEEGSITREELKTHARRNIIFPALGNMKDSPTVDIDILSGGFDYGDVLLICSDGLSDNLSALDIQEILDLPKPLPKRLEMLVKMALERGSTDNITIAAIIYDGE